MVSDTRSLLTVDGMVWDVSNLCSRRYKPRRSKRRSSMSDYDARKRLESERMYPVLSSTCLVETPLLSRTSSWPKIETMEATTTETAEERHNNSCSSFSSELSLEVAPGNVLAIHGAEETSRAIDSGRVIQTRCLACETDLLCIDCAAVVLCPTCKCLTPLDLEHDSDSQGIGLGVLTSY